LSYLDHLKPEHGHVLNGFLYALLSLWECGRYFKSAKARSLFSRGVGTLKKRLPDFELIMPGFKWSRYDNRKIFYSGIHYHKRVHVYQLKILAGITKEQYLKDAYRRWDSYTNMYEKLARMMDFAVLPIIKMRGLLGL
jgi:hypothetical protein